MQKTKKNKIQALLGLSSVLNLNLNLNLNDQADPKTVNELEKKKPNSYQKKNPNKTKTKPARIFIIK